MDRDEPGAAHVGQAGQVDHDPPRAAVAGRPAGVDDLLEVRAVELAGQADDRDVRARSVGRDVHRLHLPCCARRRLRTVTSLPPVGRIRWSNPSVSARARWIAHAAEPAPAERQVERRLRNGRRIEGRRVVADPERDLVGRLEEGDLDRCPGRPA